MTETSYPAARLVARTLESYFARFSVAAAKTTTNASTPLVSTAAAAAVVATASSWLTPPSPTAAQIETIIDAAFWASLRREEGYSPKISLALFPPAHGQAVMFERNLPLSPAALARLAPAVERPGIHLGVWHDDDDRRIISSDSSNGGSDDVVVKADDTASLPPLCVWGTARQIPAYCFVLEVIEPGLLVVKYRRVQETGKFVNVLVLKGDQIKEIDEMGTSLPDCPALVESLLGFGSPAADLASEQTVNVLVLLAASMRTHGRGGTLLVVGQKAAHWRESIVPPVNYSVAPHYAELANLMRQEARERHTRLWQEALQDAIEHIAGTTAVDGATIINDEYELLAFGAKIGRREGGTRVEQVIVTEPIVGGTAEVVHPATLGGTRHLSAAQFVQDQPDAVALVASQDGRFTVFAWSPCEEMVHAHRVETLLL